MRFLQDADYAALIKTEILKLIDGSTPVLADNYKLLIAEKMAVSQMRKWMAARFDIDAIFIPPGDPDTRDEFIVMMAIDLTLYHLYSQTPHRDVPTHRAIRYQDALDWLKGSSSPSAAPTDLPTNVTDDSPIDTRIWSDRPPENHYY